MKSEYNGDKPKPDLILGEERNKKKLIQEMEYTQEALAFKSKMEMNSNVVTGIRFVDLKFRKPLKADYCIVYFKFPLDKELIERRIHNAFALPKEKED